MYSASAAVPRTLLLGKLNEVEGREGKEEVMTSEECLVYADDLVMCLG
jgi:hypothetical protein